MYLAMTSFYIEFFAEAEDKRTNEDYNDVKEVIEGVEAKEIEVLEKISPIEKPVILNLRPVVLVLAHKFHFFKKIIPEYKIVH